MTDNLFIFCIYSVLGWVLETVYFAFKTKKLVKRGVLHGAYCPLYGTSIAVCTALTNRTINNIFFTFIICAAICTAFELITGILLDKVLNKKMWDYTGCRFSIGGYICLSFSVIWGVLGVLSIRFFNPIILSAEYAIKLIFSLAIILFMIIDILSFIKIRNKSVDI